MLTAIHSLSSWKTLFRWQLLKRLLWQLAPFFALLVIILLFGLADGLWGQGRFLSFPNMRVIMSSAALIAVPAFGMTIIIISGGIDLSAGTALTLSGTVLAYMLKHSPSAAPDSLFAEGAMLFVVWMSLAMLAMILTGCLCGLFNGTLISATKVVPFIVTLGTMTIYLGIGQILANESTVYAPRENIPDWMSLCYTGSNPNQYLIPPFGLFGWDVALKVPTSVIIAVALAVFLAMFMRYTVFGRNVFALGSSESTARLCGINVPLTIIAVYTMAGLFVAIGGLLYFADVKNGNPKDGTGKELEIIAAVVLGGGSLSGGRGSIFGTMIGALIITVIRSGCSQLAIPNTYTLIIIGGIIIIAVIVDQLRHGSPEWFFRLLPGGRDSP